ncbi:MAG: hypothetical protein JWP94_3266 [Mucilaginibacter sp.]|jgi:uncharacterized membrane protein|nr:hypothetical protein [Mucilaginibacter sp.]
MEPVKDIVHRISDNSNGKTAAVISYLTIFGWIVAYFGFHQGKKTDLGSYQLRQTLLFYIVYIVIRYGISFIFSPLWVSEGVFSLYYCLKLIEFLFFILWIIGFIGAINGEKKPIPFIGERAQTMFSTL